MITLFRPKISEEAIAAAGEVLRSGWLGLGPRTQEFEQAFASYVGANYCVGLNSCTSALHLALHLLDLPIGTEVITTALTFVSTNHAILYEGLTPVFADIDPRTGNLDPVSIAEKITDQTGAIVVVHYGGYPCDLDEIYSIARERGIAVIEDCAHACGATYKGRRIGSHGDMHAFSFHAVKNLAMGDGGALTVSRSADNDRLRRLRWLGIDKDTYRRTSQESYDWEYEVPEVGFKYHMNDIQAAIGLAQLRMLDEENARREAMVKRYRQGLGKVPGITLRCLTADRTSSYHLFPILTDRRDDLIRKLHESGIGAGVHYQRNDDYPMYGHADLPHTEWFSLSVLSLPLHLHLTDEDIDRVCDTISAGW